MTTTTSVLMPTATATPSSFSGYSVTSVGISASGMVTTGVPQPTPTKPDGFYYYNELLGGGDIGKVGCLYPERFTGNAPAFPFHFAVWDKLHHGQYDDYAFLAVKDDPIASDGSFATNSLLVFGSKRTQRAFRKWWRGYRRLFEKDTIDQTCLPTALTSKRVRGAVIPFKLKLDGMIPVVNHEAIEVWAWIVANCRARVWRIADAFIFANDVDAVAFKLKWC